MVECSSYIQDVWNVIAKVGEPLGLTPGPRGTPFGAVPGSPFGETPFGASAADDASAASLA